jgi:hypothetical protein
MRDEVVDPGNPPPDIEEPAPTPGGPAEPVTPLRPDPNPQPDPDPID